MKTSLTQQTFVGFLSIVFVVLLFPSTDDAFAATPRLPFQIQESEQYQITRTCNRRRCNDRQARWIVKQNGFQVLDVSAKGVSEFVFGSHLNHLNGAFYEIALYQGIRRPKLISNVVQYTYRANTRDVLVLMVNFTDSHLAFSRDLIERIYFDPHGDNPASVRAYFEETSLGAESIQGSVQGPYDLNIAASCTTGLIQSEALRAFQTANPTFSFDDVDHLVIFAARLPCAWAGSASTHDSVPVTIGGEQYSLGTSTINHNATTHVLTHELLHNLRLRHSGALDCGTEVVQRPGYPACQLKELGDTINIMDTSSLFHLNASQKAFLGWIPPEQVIAVSTNGTYTVRPVEVLNFNPAAGMLLKIPARRNTAGDVISYFYAEFRQPLGYFDGNLPSAVTTGLRLFQGSDLSNTLLLDLSPETPSLTDGVLPLGATFRDPVSGVAINVLGISQGAITVSVTGLD